MILMNFSKNALDNTKIQFYNMHMDDKKNWYAVGFLPTGETVYVNNKGEFAKEIDYRYLGEITNEELKTVIPDPNYDHLLQVYYNALKEIKSKLENILKQLKEE